MQPDGIVLLVEQEEVHQEYGDLIACAQMYIEAILRLTGRVVIFEEPRGNCQILYSG